MDAFLIVWGIILPTLEEIKPGARLRGLDPAGIADVVQVARFRHRRPESRVQSRRPRVRTAGLSRRGDLV